MDPASYQAAGLYDPASPKAAERLALLEWLSGRGVSIDEMVRALHAHSLTGLAGDLALNPGARLTAAELGERVGWSEDRVIALSRAAGIRVLPGEKAYTEADEILFTSFTTAEALFGAAPVRRFTQTLGAATATIAEAAVSLFQVTVEGPMRDEGRSELELAQENLRAVESLPGVEALMQLLFRAHMAAATRRLREARPRASVDTAPLAVGFVDLVGFTPLADRMSPRELREVVERFEDSAYDVVTSGGGRLVKIIGDAVMFVAVAPAAACDIALTLVERFAEDASVTPRGGIAVGDLLVRGGDYYGPIVNLAARIADLAVPSEMLVTQDVAAQGGAGLRFEPAGKRMVKGLDAPVSLLTVERAVSAHGS
jgi:adenylate cyclase